MDFFLPYDELLFKFYSNFLNLKAAEQIVKLYKLFRKLDCTQLEINPFGETPDKRGTFFLIFSLIAHHVTFESVSFCVYSFRMHVIQNQDKGNSGIYI